MNPSDKELSQSMDIAGECSCSNLTKDNNYLCEDTNDDTVFEGVFERPSDCLDSDGKMIISDHNVGTVFRKCILVVRRTKSILQRCVEHLNSANNENFIPNIFATFVSVCEDESMSDLIQPLSKYIVRNIDRYVDDTEFLEASHHILKILFSYGNSTECSSEKEQFGAFTLLTRWVSHNYDERKLCFNELVKLINVTQLLPKYHCVESINHHDVHKNESPTKSDNLNKELTKDKMGVLHVFVQNPQPDPRGMKLKVFSRKSTEWVLTDELTHPCTDNMRNVVINDKLYRLSTTNCNNRNQRCQIFSMGHSAQLTLNHYLTPPPPMSSYDMCGLGNNVYLYGLVNDMSEKFSEEELTRGIFGYNEELDMWYSLSAKNYTEMDVGYLTADEQHRGLYLTGWEDNFSLAQRYDLRGEEWQILPHPSSVSKVTGCVMHQGKLYVGGFDGKGSAYFEVYDPIAGKWDHNLKLVFPASRIINSKILLNNDELCFFNYNSAYNMLMNWSYNLNRSRWYSSPSLSAAILKDYPQINLCRVTIQDAVVF